MQLQKLLLMQKKYWKDYNSSYPDWDVDCANFVSQCLYAGEKTMKHKYPKIDVGWYESIGGYFSYNYLWQFWNSTSSGKSVRQAALDAANKIPEYCPIRFYGNRNYDGFY